MRNGAGSRGGFLYRALVRTRRRPTTTVRRLSGLTAILFGLSLLAGLPAGLGVNTNIITQITPTATPGQAISDTATVFGPPAGPARTGTVTFSVFGPNDDTCSGAPIFVSAAQLLTPAGPLAPPPPRSPSRRRWRAPTAGSPPVAVIQTTPSPPAAATPTSRAVVAHAVPTITTQATPTARWGSPSPTPPRSPSRPTPPLRRAPSA